MRFVLNEPEKADIKKIEKMKVVKGSFTQSGQFQVIIGNTVADFYNDFTAAAGIEGVSKETVKPVSYTHLDVYKRQDKYFDEQLERIREIRVSERKFYQKITDIYATAIDYDKTSATTKRFYATVQNKMHFAVHGHTAAELIIERADQQKEHMGLTIWADAPDGKIKKSDVTIAKNYLSENELYQLNRMVTAYLDFAENMTLRHIPLTMEDWEKRLNSFIEMFDYGIRCV